MFTRDLPTFLERNAISSEVWERSGFTWEQLVEIADHYEARKIALGNAAEFLVKPIQQLPQVHSVRWRIKDTEHVLEKIVRKRFEGSSKYLTITRENYTEKITDLIGLRAIHLFKVDCYRIDAALRELWKPLEKPIIYIREGDQPPVQSKSFSVKKHPAGYRSIHYVLSSQPVQEPIKFELQVRTIFEEGWSEIDHQIRYPNFSDNPLVSYFLTIFNRMAGSADEMGGFVQDLVSTLKEAQAEVENKEASLRAMENQIHELTELKKQDAESQHIISNLKSEIDSLRRMPSHDSMTALGSRAMGRKLGLFGSVDLDSAVRKIVKDSLAYSSSAKDVKELLSNTSSAAALARALKDMDKK
ncbi:RelA/SpoT domain-containing protein [Paralcaligenes ureilyticus]|uniref:PpGpp synthetase/RelA/SpoT-type nucleotidyltransferase n=1 Tax=Paralcaligenes ureilyticus TaxID=627131 RepID=A0A4R3M263_9BURK|nr:hypothetical protein [Paralcaligenes ureilyticus]TCT07082.1 ppGpp synthetase/RelA/SpoT-type nucleotidyltransferase [Paralcaligenes ureilyticus]